MQGKPRFLNRSQLAGVANCDPFRVTLAIHAGAIESDAVDGKGAPLFAEQRVAELSATLNRRDLFKL